ncbi:MAG: OB-fold nucleic acid binding domain-containing protein [Balneolaceae bacterium]
MNVSKVVRVEHLGMMPTMDIEIDSDDHIFYGNGIATSNSHSVCYGGYLAYWTAWLKVHFPIHFFTSWLTYSLWKQIPKDEIVELVDSCRITGAATVRQPDITIGNVSFKSNGNDIVFGLMSIRGVGTSATEILSALKERYKPGKRYFYNLLLDIHKIKRNVAEALIKSGACDKFEYNRSFMLQCVYSVYGTTERDTEGKIKNKSGLSNKELKAFSDDLSTQMETSNEIPSLERSFTVAIDAAMKKRKPLVENLYNKILEIHPETNTDKAFWERDLLGLPLSCSAADDISSELSDTKCSELIYKRKGATVKVACLIEQLKLMKTREDKEYAYLRISDSTGSCNRLVVWPEVFQKNRDKLAEDEVLVLTCKIDHYKGKNQLVVTKVTKGSKKNNT